AHRRALITRNALPGDEESVEDGTARQRGELPKLVRRTGWPGQIVVLAAKPQEVSDWPGLTSRPSRTRPLLSLRDPDEQAVRATHGSRRFLRASDSGLAWPALPGVTRRRAWTGCRCWPGRWCRRARVRPGPGSTQGRRAGNRGASCPRWRA